MLAATDPANPYGTILRWPERADRRGPRGQRRADTVGWLARRDGQRRARGLHQPRRRQLLAFLPEDEPARSTIGARARDDAGADSGCWFTRSTASPPPSTRWRAYLVEAGFSPSAMGFQIRHAGLGTWRVASRIAMPEGDTIYRAAATCTARSRVSPSSASSRCFRR